MTEKEAQNFISTITYKHNSSITALRQMDSDALSIRISIIVPDRETSEPIPIVQNTFIPYEQLKNFDEMNLLRLITSAIYEMEKHEANEWIRVNGKLVLDMHERT